MAHPDIESQLLSRLPAAWHLSSSPSLTRLSLARLSLARLSLARLSLARLSLAHLSLARLSLARLGLARLSLARPCSSPDAKGCTLFATIGNDGNRGEAACLWIFRRDVLDRHREAGGV